MIKYLIALILLCSLEAWTQEELLNQCFVFTIDSELKTDVREATFDLPFAAMRASKENEKQVVPHYMFDVQAASANESLKNGLKITSLRPYVYGETLADNEIAFFAMEWPQDYRPKGSGPILASFPSINGHDVKTDHLILNQKIELPEILVKQLKLTSSYLEPGAYALIKQDIEY